MIGTGMGKIEEMMFAIVTMLIISGALGLVTRLFLIPRGKVIAYVGEFSMIPLLLKEIEKARDEYEKEYLTKQVTYLKEKMLQVVFETKSQERTAVYSDNKKVKNNRTIKNRIKRFLIDLTVEG